MSALRRFFYGGHATARAELFTRGFLLLLAFDAWRLGIPATGRYGLGGFNVAHFGWLDALLPVPSAGLAVGLLVLSGLLAFGLALSGIRRGPLLALCALYTLAWSISMIDSYQHHYLLSIVLVCLAFFPRRAAPRERFAAGFGVGLLLASVAIVYAFTSVAKFDADWLNGDTLRAMRSFEQRLGDLSVLASGWGLDGERIFALLATAVIPVELFVAFAYLVAALRDRCEQAWMCRVCALALLAAAGLHGGIEWVGLRIGWFSWYMLLLAACFLAPLRVVEPAASALARGLRVFEASGPLSRRMRSRALLWAGAAALLLLAVGSWLGLPGALAACGLAAVALVVGVALALRAEAPRDPRPWLRAAATAALALWVAVATGHVRWDFYRHRAGDLVSLGELHAALGAYRLAERDAPAGETRAREIEELERRLGR